MDDILIRLRRVPEYPGLTLCKDAADEIERLRAELAKCKELLRECDEAMSWECGGEPLPSLMLACRKKIAALAAKEVGNDPTPII